MGSEELEMEEGDFEEGSEYENGEEIDEEEDGEELEGELEEEEEEEEEDELQDSATEIETDSEFDQNSSVDVCVAPQGIPTIVVNESEAELKRSTDHLANGDEDYMDDPPVNVASNEQQKRAPEEPRADYVHQYVPLDHARPLQRTVSNDSAPPSSIPSASAGRSGVLAYLRRSELLEKSPSATDMMASKNSLELKKKYLLDYPGPVGSLTQKSASTTNLDSKLKSFVDKISEAQNKLNPAPQPSVPMQVLQLST